MYSLWLMPDGKAFEKLKRLIIDLSTQHNTPRFQPHVTLLSGIVDDKGLAIEKTKDLAASLAPMRASLTRIEYLEFFYRCLFFRTDDSSAIYNAREAAEELFEHTFVRPFVPHVSFLYGALPVFQKREIINQLGDSFFMNFSMSKLGLVKTQLTPEHWDLLCLEELAG